MKNTALLSLTLVFAAPITTSAVWAQNQPPSGQLPGGLTPEQAAALLQQNPALGEMLQSQLNTSGMSAEEIRSRLSTSGYPATILDPYMSRDSGTVPLPTPQALSAARSLGLGSFAAQDSILLYGDAASVQRLRDSLRIDSILRAELRDRVLPRLKIFGLEAFRRPTNEYSALTAGPVDQNYRLGPGDGLMLLLTGEAELAIPLDVTREGYVFIPDVGQVFVNNLSLGQLRDVLYARLARVYSGINRRPDARTKFAIEVTRVRAISVRVLGEVGRPGAYQVGATGGLLSALYQAGGPSQQGSFRSVRVVRGSDSLATVDLYRYLLTGSAPSDVRLDGGDAIYVPIHGARVQLAGEVMRPAIYELAPGEGLRELIKVAGGLSPRAAATNITITRLLPLEQRTTPGRERTVVTVPLTAALDPSSPPTPLFPEDSVTVMAVRGGRTSSVTINGSVWQPSTYRLDPEMRLWDLIRVAGGLRPETYAGRAQIVRSLPDSTKLMLGVVLDSTAPNNNPRLSELDKITVYPRTEFRPDRFIGVYGSVRKPGLVVFSDSMTLRDAVLLAGGTTEDAYLAQAEVSRIRMDGAAPGDSIAMAIKVPLDSSYVGDPTGYLNRPVGVASAPAVPLQPYDNVYIRRQPGLEAQRTVVLGGEVRFPGRYSLVSKNERLSDLIQRAGGLTPRAYTNGVRFFRLRYDHAAGSGLQTPTESRELEHGGVAGGLPMSRIGVDLERVLKDARYRDNLTLSNGDSIYLPAFIPVVVVEGAVNAPTSVTYVPGAGVGYYVNAAGGYMKVADKRGTFIQQPNGRITKRGNPEPGALVSVPRRDPSIPNQFALPAILGLIGQLATAATTVIVVALTR